MKIIKNDGRNGLKMMKIVVLLMVILVFVAACDVDETGSLPKAEGQDEAEEKDDTGPIIEPEEPSESSDDTVSKENDGAEVDENVGFAGITQQQCNDAGGHWNTCGSPCAGTRADFCIEVCQVQCECGSIAGFSCPEGFKCRLTGTIADEIGVCVVE